MNAADYALQQVKGIKKVFDNAMTGMMEQFMDNQIVQFYVTNEETEIFTSTEGLTGIIDLGAETTPPSLALEDGYTASFSPSRKGGAIVIPETVYAVDSPDATTKVKEFLTSQSNQLLKAVKSHMLYGAYYMLNNAFNASALTLAPDSVELCGTHTWATGGTFSNEATAALDADAIDDLEEYAGDFYDPTDTTRPFPHDFSVIIVKKGTDNARMAKRLFAYGISPITVDDVNIYKGSKTIVETPWITTANKNYWFARDVQFDNSVILGINQTPSLREPIVLENQAIRTNCTTHWKRGVRNIPHDWYGSDGTT